MDGWQTLVARESVASGAEDLLSRLIGMRLLSESRVTQRGSFLMRGGAVHPVDALGDGFLPSFTL